MASDGLVALSEWSRVEAINLALSDAEADLQVSLESRDLASAAERLNTMADIHERRAEAATLTLAAVFQAAALFDDGEADNGDVANVLLSEFEERLEDMVNQGLDESALTLAIDGWRWAACARSVATDVGAYPSSQLGVALAEIEGFLENPGICFETS